MESYIQISKINDFIFCPRSVYLHSIYESFGQQTYHSAYQTAGKIKHEAIDKGSYSNRKRYLLGKEVFSEKYNLAGKIDIYDCQNKTLIERKNKIKNIYDGYKYQLYAQMLCLKEMGYPVKKIILHSLSDNQRYFLPQPSAQDMTNFNTLLDKIISINVKDINILNNQVKCQQCIYKSLCH